MIMKPTDATLNSKLLGYEVQRENPGLVSVEAQSGVLSLAFCRVVV